MLFRRATFALPTTSHWSAVNRRASVLKGAPLSLNPPTAHASVPAPSIDTSCVCNEPGLGLVTVVHEQAAADVGAAPATSVNRQRTTQIETGARRICQPSHTYRS